MTETEIQLAKEAALKPAYDFLKASIIRCSWCGVSLRDGVGHGLCGQCKNKFKPLKKAQNAN